MVASISDYPFRELPTNWDAFLEQQKHIQHPALADFYQQPWVNPAALLCDASMVALDIETTGLDALTDEIVSIGLVPFDTRRIYCRQAKYWLVQTKKLSDISIPIHGITHSEIEQAPSLATVLNDVLCHLKGKQVVVHYRYMEREFLRQAAANMWQEVLLFPVIDTFELEAEYLRATRPFWNRLTGKKRPSARLPDCRERYHLPVYGNHNALTDALATAELMQAQIQYWQAQKNATRDWWR